MDNHPLLQRALSPRGLFGLMAATSAGLMLFALYLQEVLGEEPCPLCITQRVFVIAIGLCALFAALQNPAATGRRLWAGFTLLFAAGGGVVAGRHVWIQHLPEDQIPACGPGLAYLFENFPLQHAVRLLFLGNGNCAEVGWTFLTLSIPEWTLICFMGFAGFSLFQLFRKA